jgi:hypothetical protein
MGKVLVSPASYKYFTVIKFFSCCSGVILFCVFVPFLYKDSLKTLHTDCTHFASINADKYVVATGVNLKSEGDDFLK